MWRWIRPWINEGLKRLSVREKILELREEPITVSVGAFLPLGFL